MFQTIIGRTRPQISNITNRLGSQRDRSSATATGQIPLRSLYIQRAAWITAGGGMAATLQGVYMMLRSFRHLKYI